MLRRQFLKLMAAIGGMLAMPFTAKAAERKTKVFCREMFAANDVPAIKEWLAAGPTLFTECLFTGFEATEIVGNGSTCSECVFVGQTKWANISSPDALADRHPVWFIRCEFVGTRRKLPPMPDIGPAQR